MRAFIAVELNDVVRENFSRIENKLMASDADVKWVKPFNAHLTLKFLGEIDEQQAETIKGFMDDIAGGISSFETAFSGLGFFPNERRPRVIWIGINRGVDKLKILASEIDEKTSTLGIEKEERDFSPHLTLGRLRSQKNLPELLRLFEKTKDFDAGGFIVGEIHLIESVLQQSGPVYTKLYSASLLNQS